MARGKPLSIDIRKLIIDFNKKGENNHEISRILSIPRSTVRSVIKNFQSTRDLAPKVKCGRRSKFSPADMRCLGRIITSNRRASSVEIASKLSQSSKKKVSSRHCQRLIKKLNYGFYTVGFDTCVNLPEAYSVLCFIHSLEKSLFLPKSRRKND